LRNSSLVLFEVTADYLQVLLSADVACPSSKRFVNALRIGFS